MALLSSTKWMVTLASIAAVAVVKAMGNMTAEQFVDALKWLVGIGVGARALEDGLAKRPPNGAK